MCCHSNQDLPKHTPLMCLDVWEHAYYINYQNKRGTFVEQWWRLVDWGQVQRRFAATMAKQTHAEL